MNGKENTFRRLTEEPLLVTSFWCRFGWHNWTKYRDPENIREGIWNYIVQNRACASCNLHDRKIINKV